MDKLLVDDNNLVDNLVKSSFWDFRGKHDFVDKWFLMGTPYPVMAITMAYLLFVLKLGPAYLKNRRPFELKNVLLIYNIFQVAVSVWMVQMCLVEAREVGIIQRTCMTDTEYKHRLVTIGYYYFSCKITELLDTIFFVLRKKQSQVTFLHVYHHTSMVLVSWMILKYEPGYWLLFGGLLNCFVHVIMYTYYGLSAFQSLQKYLWWKKYLTSLQLVQFGLALIQITINSFVNECKPSRAIVFYLYINLLLFVYLFYSFYKKSYSLKNNKINKNKSTNKSKLTFENGIKYKNDKKQGGDDFQMNRETNQMRDNTIKIMPKNSKIN